MARHDLKYDDELDEWLTAEAKRQGISKTALIVSILRASQQNQESPEALGAGDDHSEPAAEPIRTPSGPDPDMAAKTLKTIEMFFQRYLADHPPMIRTDAEKESLNERWEIFLALRDKELLK